MPHAERANTASFLEEVIHYIEELQALLKVEQHASCRAHLSRRVAGRMRHARRHRAIHKSSAKAAWP